MPNAAAGIAALALVATLLNGCANHRVDTVPEWCEQITNVNLQEKYQPFWAVIFSVSIEADAIRDHYVAFLNDTYMEKVQKRSPRMAWREGTQLHLINLSTLLVLDPSEFIAEWRKGIEADNANAIKDRGGRCLYGTLTSLFDSLHIHSIELDALGREEKDEITVLSTEREARLGKRRL